MGKSIYFAGEVLPKGSKKAPTNEFDELLNFTHAQTQGLSIGRGLPIHMDHPNKLDLGCDFPGEGAKIGEVLQSFNFKSGEKGVIGRFDTDTASGRYFEAKHLRRTHGTKRRGPALSLGHRQRKFIKKAGEKNELGTHTFPKDGEEITKEIHHLATCENPAREGCRVLFWFAEGEYKEEDPEEYLKTLVKNKYPKELEMADTKMNSPSAKPDQDEASAKATLATQKKKDLLTLNYRLQEKLSKALDETATSLKEKESLQGELTKGKKLNEENEYLKKMMQDSFTTQMEKNFGKFSKLTGMNKDEEKSLNDNFKKGMMPSSGENSDEGIETLNKPTFAQNLVDQMVCASEKTINELRNDLASARNESHAQKQTPLANLESSSSSSSSDDQSLPHKRARMDESSPAPVTGPATSMLNMIDDFRL